MKSIRPNGLIRNRLAIAAAMVVGASAPAFAADHFCTTTAQVQTALTNASLTTNDTITLDANATFLAPSGGFVLPNKTGTGRITIRSSALASLPAAGTRVNLTHANNMPLLRPSNTTSSVFTTATSAHHFTLVGLEIVGPTADTQPDGITDISHPPINLGTSGTAQDTIAEAPNNIIIDRCIIRANSNSQRIRRGIAMNSASTDVTNCYIAGFKDVDGNDTQAISCFNGPGPFNIINNYLEAGAENVLFGGGVPTIPNLVPSDIVIKKNHFSRPLTWNQNHASYAGLNWVIKNIFEIKNGRNVLVEGNIMEHNWVDGQSGWSIVLTPANDGPATWTVAENVTFKNNVIRGIGGGPNVIGFDQGGDVSEQTNNIKFENNLWYDIGGSLWGNGKWAQMLDHTDTVTFDHNTVFNPSSFMTVDTGPHTGFIFRNNIVNREGGFGLIGGGFAEGSASITGNYPSAIFTANVIKSGSSSRYSAYPGNFFPADWNFLVNKTGGNYLLGHWDIAAGHAYNNAGTDGKDLGADIPAIITATAGCITGVWSNPPTTITLKNGVNGYTGASSFHVRGQAPTVHNGSSAYYHQANSLVGTNSFVERAFYKFDVSQAASGIPSGSTVTNATLRIKLEFRSHTFDYGISCFRMAPASSFTVNYATATRNTYNGTNSWTGGSNAGDQDHITTPVDNNSTIPAVGQWIDFDVTTAVQAWVNGTANNGLFIKTNSGSSNIGVRTSTVADSHGSTEYPTLEVTYQ